MLQKISDFIISELQSMLKNRQQSQKKSGGLAPWTPNGALPLDPAGGWRPRLARYAPLQSPNVNSNNFLATSRKTFSVAMLHEYFNLVYNLPTL